MSTVPRLRNPGLDALLFRTGVPLTQPCIAGTSPASSTQKALNPCWWKCRQSMVREQRGGPVFPIPPDVLVSSIFFFRSLSLLLLSHSPSLFLLSVLSLCLRKATFAECFTMSKELSLCDLQNNTTREILPPYSIQGETKAHTI